MQETEATTRAPARSFRDLLVWRKAHQFILEVYRLTGSFPKTETYGLTSQLQRATFSLHLRNLRNLWTEKPIRRLHRLRRFQVGKRDEKRPS